MNKNNKNGFTLVELLAVIVILAIILVIAVPKVMSIIEDAKMGTLESTAKMIASQAEKQKVQNTVLGNDKAITCEGITNINKEDYPSCEITFDDNTAKVTIVGGGKFEGLNICGGTKTEATATKEECRTTPPVLNCEYNGDLVQGAEFTHNQYTYRYKQEYLYEWQNIEQDGWGVRLTNLDSLDPVNTPTCSYINGKPVVSMSGMFLESAATTIDLSSLDTSNVTSMSHMFAHNSVTNLDLSSFDTSNVTNMLGMFMNIPAISLNLSNFDTSNVTNMSDMFYGSQATSIDLSNFDTSNVTDMSYMFAESSTESLDLSSFDTSNVTDMSYMFMLSPATLDLSSFDTSNVTHMTGMFEGYQASIIYVGEKWNTSKVLNSDTMFRNAIKLVGGNGTRYVDNYIYEDKTYARVDKEGEPGYFTYKAGN